MTLLAQGHTVIVGDCDSNALESLSSGNIDGNLLIFHADLRNINRCTSELRRVISQCGAIDGYVHYAGITPIADFFGCSEELYDKVFDINLKGAFFCCQVVLNSMLQTGGGSVVLISSAHADYGEKNRAPYAISKAALEAMGRHISRHYSPDQIRCNILTMGWTLTEGERALRLQQGVDEKSLRINAGRSVPMGRMLEYDDYIEALLFLLSPESRMVTGSNIRITGGQYI